MAEKMDDLYSRRSIRDLEKRLFVARWGLRDAVKSDPDKVPTGSCASPRSIASSRLRTWPTSLPGPQPDPFF